MLERLDNVCFTGFGTIKCNTNSIKKNNINTQLYKKISVWLKSNLSGNDMMQYPTSLVASSLI